MSRSLVFMSDTHAGAGLLGFRQQPRRMDLAESAFAGLARFIRENRVGQVVHGGDLTENGSEDEIRQALALLGGLGVPAAYCLGNHDLAGKDSFQLWCQTQHPRGVCRADCVIPLDGMDLILLNNDWITDEQGEGMFWKSRPGGYQERFSQDRLAWLQQTLAAGGNRPATIVFHTPPDPIPSRLSGMPNPIHGAYPPYVEAVNEVLDQFDRVKLVLNGHNHATVATRHGGRIHLSVSAMVEAPFEFRVIRWTDHTLQIETTASFPMPLDAEYDRNRSWINGQPEDRTLSLVW